MHGRCGALPAFLYMEEHHNETEAERKAIRLTHHTERVVFPRDGKKAKAYFQNLADVYERCWCVNRIKDTFQSEVSYYKGRYGGMVEYHNQACAKARHIRRMITIEDLHGRRYTCPEELVIQAGKKNGVGIPGPEVFKGCIMQYLSWMLGWNRAHGDHLHILNVHISDKPPYRAVIRRVWDCMGKDGVVRVSMTGALRDAGVPFPDEDEGESRYNNRKMTFDRISREALYGCFEEAGITVIREPGIYTLRQALKAREEAELEEQYAKGMLRQIMETEGQAPATDPDGKMSGAMEALDGSILVPEDGYRLLKIREYLGRAYASRSRQAAERLLKALDDEREAGAIHAALEGNRKSLELEYAALRMGLLRCGYYAGDAGDVGNTDGQEGGEIDEGIAQ